MLVGQDRWSYDILKSDLEQSQRSYRFPDWMLLINQFGSMPSFLAQMGAGRSVQPFRNTKDYEDWLKRLSMVPTLFDGTIANLRVGMGKGVTQPKAIMEKVLPQLAALATSSPEDSIFWSPNSSSPSPMRSSRPTANSKRESTLCCRRCSRCSRRPTTRCASGSRLSGGAADVPAPVRRRRGLAACPMTMSRSAPTIATGNRQWRACTPRRPAADLSIKGAP